MLPFCPRDGRRGALRLCSLSLLVFAFTLPSCASAAPRVVTHSGKHLSRTPRPPAGPQLLRTIAADAFPPHQGFGDARFGVVEALESPRNADILHVGWERVQIRWDELQPLGPLQWNANATKGLYPYNQPDAPFDHEISQGRHLAGVILGVPAWAAVNPRDGAAAVPKNLWLPWNDPRNYWGQFVFRAARHYAGRIDTLIILNEVNIGTGPYRQFHGTVADYAQMLRVAYLAAHAANPRVDVHIYGDSFYADQGAWFRKTLDVLQTFPGARANNLFFDAAELHLYSTILNWDKIVASWHAIMRAHGADHPIWLSETNVPPRDDRDRVCHCLANPAEHNAPLAVQPGFLVDAFAAALGLGLPRVEVYRMVDPKQIWPEHPNGLVRWDGTLRDEYKAFITINTWFAGVTAGRYEPCHQPFVDRVCVFKVTLERPGQEIVVLWNQGGKQATVTLPALAQTATVVTPDGSTTTVRPSGGWYRFPLRATGLHSVVNPKLLKIGAAPIIVVQDLAPGWHVPGLHPLYDQGNRSSGGGALATTAGLALAPDGSGIYATADPMHDRVLVRDGHGRLMARIGGTGGAPGQLRSPSGVAIGQDGTLYVADMGNDRIQEFDLSGHLLGGFGTYEAGPASLRAPSALAVAPDNTLYVVDMAMDAVLHFTRMGGFLGRFGGPGYASGRLDGPGGIAIDGAGHIYVADTLNNRVEEFSPSGQVLGQFGSGSPGGGDSNLHWPTSVAILPGGAVAIADAANTRLVVVSSPNTYLGSITVGSVKQPGGLAVAADGSYFVSDTAADDIVHLARDGHVLATFGSRGFGRGQFFQPMGLDIGPDGNLYVADSGNNRIEVVTQSGHFVRHIGRQGHGPGQFVGPHAVSVADGTLWVADTGNARIQHLTLGGGMLGISVTGVNGAWGVAADGAGGVYYSAHWGQRVFHWMKDGHQTRWGAPGSGADEIDHPGALAAMPSANTIYVADEGNSRIQIVANGLTAGQRGGKNSSAAGLTTPVAVALTPDGAIAVLDAARLRIVRYQGGSAGKFQAYVQKGLSLGISAVTANRAYLTLVDPWTGFSTVVPVPLLKAS